MNQKQRGNAEAIRQNGEIYDVLDLKLLLMDLNKRGYDLEFSSIDAKQIQVTCRKTHNRFVIKHMGNTE